ncbi:MAG TPA: hypothetical protein VFV87_04595 [Pirellulaceae bacterium]|nr:hypothetical protein [Pirellulaceae bacterium]
MRPNENAELFGSSPLVAVDHAEHDKQDVAIFLDLGPLMEVNDVLHRQAMQSEQLAELLDQLRVPQPFDVDPGDRVVRQ